MLRYAVYAMAMLGAHIAFMPLLVLLLPRRIEALFADGAATSLSMILICGALTASVMHIFAGHWSDRCLALFGDRRRPIIVGLGILVASYALLASAQDLLLLILGIISFQIGLNLAFAPLGALITDYFSDAEKGRVAGLMNAALPISTAAVSIIAWMQPQDSAAGFLIACAMVVILIVPLLIVWPFSNLAEPGQAPVAEGGPKRRGLIWRDFALAWLARALVQTGAAFIIGYLYIYVSGTFGDLDASRRVGQLSLLAGVVAFVVAIFSGQLSDRLGRRKLPIAISAMIAATGLLILSQNIGWTTLFLAYALYHMGLTTFLSVDTAMVAQLVSNSSNRGTLLGLMNLTNTLPAVIAPAATLLMLDQGQTSSALAEILFLAAIGSLVAGVLVLSIRSVR